MAKKRESRLQAKIHRMLKREFKWHGWKIHGGPFQAKGIPDLVGCISGLFFGIEVKLPTGKKRVEQIRQVKAIKAAGGYATFVTSEEEARRFVLKALRKEDRMLVRTETSAEKSHSVRSRSTSKSFRVDFQATARKDLHRRRRRREARA